MRDKILGTVSTRIIVAILSFLIWILNARLLGPEKVGTISLIVFSIAIIQLLTNFFSGAALVYYTPRVGISRLLLPAYVWNLVVTLSGTGILMVLPLIHSSLELIPKTYLFDIVLLTIIISCGSVNLNLMLGLEKVKQFNYLSLLQVALLVVILMIITLVLDFLDVRAYILAMGISWFVTFIAGIRVLAPSLVKTKIALQDHLFRDVLRFGTFVQVANLFQTFNYRLSLKFADLFLGRASVGILSVGMALAEGLWVIGRSISTVQFSRLSNESDFGQSVKITLILMKITGLVTAAAMIVLLLIPDSWFQLLFTQKFVGLKVIIGSLSFGIVILSISMILSGFFSGINKPRHNTVSSAIGFLFTCVLGLLLIPTWGLAGAGLAATASYTAATIYQLVVFFRLSKLKPADLLLKRREAEEFIREIRKIVAKNR